MGSQRALKLMTEALGSQGTSTPTVTATSAAVASPMARSNTSGTAGGGGGGTAEASKATSSVHATLSTQPSGMRDAPSTMSTVDSVPYAAAGFLGFGGAGSGRFDSGALPSNRSSAAHETVGGPPGAANAGSPAAAASGAGRVSGAGTAEGLGGLGGEAVSLAVGRLSAAGSGLGGRQPRAPALESVGEDRTTGASHSAPLNLLKQATSSLGDAGGSAERLSPGPEVQNPLGLLPAGACLWHDVEAHKVGPPAMGPARSARKRRACASHLSRLDFGWERREG